MSPEPREPREPVPTGTTAVTKLSASAGIIAAMVLALVVNVFAARHYKRWDWTRGGLYTLSAATLQTLHALEEPVHVYVLLPSADPQTISLRHLLDAYGAETTRLAVEFTDPDRHPAEFLAVQQRFGLVAGKTEDGRIVTDASVVVVRGDKPWFITARDLVAVDDEEDLRARPRLEQALTAGIRSVISSERPKACLTSGHGEKSSEVGGGAGLAQLRERLVKNNFEVADLGPARATDKESIDECRVLIVAGPNERVAPEDVARYRGYLEKGGNVLLAVGPQPDAGGERYQDLGLGDLFAAGGLRLNQDFIFELDPKRRSPQGFGETFTPAAKPHAVTDGLLKTAAQGVEVVLTVGSSLTPTGASWASPVPLLVTSDEAFGMVDFFSWAKNPVAPSALPADHKGPLTVAYATELPKPSGSSLPHGGRLVAVGAASALFGANWQSEELRGTALFVESAISWLTARPVMLDIPTKPAFTAGLRLTEDSLSGIFRYVIGYMPLASLLLGVAVYLRRRGTERRGVRGSKGAKGETKG